MLKNIGRKRLKNSSKYFLLALGTFVVGFIYLKLAYYRSESFPYAQEVILIILGTIATISITAALINKQSEVELEKEQRVKIFDLKSSLYIDLINFIESLILKGKLEDRDLLHLEFLTHKISIVASYEVLKQYTDFIDAIKRISEDAKISSLDSDIISEELSELCGKIRYDLIQRERHVASDVEKLLTKNIKKF